MTVTEVVMHDRATWPVRGAHNSVMFDIGSFMPPILVDRVEEVVRCDATVAIVLKYGGSLYKPSE